MRGPLEHVMIYAAIFSNRYGGCLLRPLAASHLAVRMDMGWCCANGCGSMAEVAVSHSYYAYTRTKQLHLLIK